MDIHNFKLNSVFHENAKEYVTRPVMAAKYQSGMENGFCVFYSNEETKEHMMHEGIRFFPSEAEAWDFIRVAEKQYAMENGKLVGLQVEYDTPRPVLYRKWTDMENRDNEVSYINTEYAFISNETEEYEFEMLDVRSWIVMDMDGAVRAWHPDLDETFFGNEKDIIYEKAAEKEEYIKVIV